LFSFRGAAVAAFSLPLTPTLHTIIADVQIFARYVRESFGERLHVVPVETDPMPSPASLRGKVLLKV
jgi:hypothetical protein